MSFHVGQKIVCVNDKPIYGTFFDPGRPRLTEGGIYTVSGYCERASDNKPTVWLREVDWERGYFAQRFRPIVSNERKMSTA